MKEEQTNDFIEIVQKVERLSSAVFLVSDTMSETEAGELKKTTRTISLGLLTEAASLNTGSVGDKIKKLYSVQSLALNLSSLFQVSAVSGFVSPMNASLIRENIDSFLHFLNHYSAHLNDTAGAAMKDHFQAVKSPLELMSQNSAPVVISRLGHNEDTSNKTPKTNRKDTREKTILDFIKTKDSVNIKDIAKNVKGCSEKTIQRELIKMVDSGLIKKTGERRWSRYSYIEA